MMRQLLSSILLLGSLSVFAQTIELDKSYSDLPALAEGRTYLVPFKVKGTIIGGNLTVTISVNKGSMALNRREFELRKNTKDQADRLIIQPVNYAGKFHLYIRGDLELTSAKEIKLDFVIDDNNSLNEQIITINLQPASPDDPRKNEKNESAELELYKDLDVFVHNKKVKDKEKKKISKIVDHNLPGGLINIDSVGITDMDNNIYLITIYTTEGETYAFPGGFDLSDGIKDEHIVYLDGDSTKAYIQLKDFMKINEEEKKAPPAKVLNPQNRTLKIEKKGKKKEEPQTNPIKKN